MPQPTPQQIDRILPFLTRFEAPGFKPGRWDDSSGQMPYFIFDEAVTEFQQALYDNGWVTPIDWTKWQDSAREYVESPEKIESADAETIRNLFTTHARKDRFCEGHLAAMSENGHIVALLRRLKMIRASMDA